MLKKMECLIAEKLQYVVYLYDVGMLSDKIIDELDILYNDYNENEGDKTLYEIYCHYVKYIKPRYFAEIMHYINFGSGVYC